MNTPRLTMKINKSILLTLTLSLCITSNVKSAETDKKEPLQHVQMMVPYPILIVGGAVVATTAWKTTKFVTRLSLRCLSNPIIGVGTGVFVASPVLKRTLFAKEPQTDLNKLREEIEKEWNDDIENAQVNLKNWEKQFNSKYDAALKDFEQKHPVIYKKIQDIYQDEQVQQSIKIIKEKSSELNKIRKEKQNELADWLKKKN